jgi:hypothetical protein
LYQSIAYLSIWEWSCISTAMGAPRRAAPRLRLPTTSIPHRRTVSRVQIDPAGGVLFVVNRLLDRSPLRLLWVFFNTFFTLTSTAGGQFSAMG